MHAMRRLNDEEPTDTITEARGKIQREIERGSRFRLAFLSQFRSDWRDRVEVREKYSIFEDCPKIIRVVTYE